MYKVDGQKLLQYPGELEQLIDIFRANDVRSYLEIGCKYGGSLWYIGRSLPAGSSIVGVDLMAWEEQAMRLRTAASKLTGYKVTLVKGDSSNPNIVRDVAKLGPFDACLIDGNHSLPYVAKDWENYGPMCRMVAFHDINYHRTPEELKALKAEQNKAVFAIDVPIFWNEVKANHRHEEIKLDRRDNGIGVLWR